MAMTAKEKREARAARRAAQAAEAAPTATEVLNKEATIRPDAVASAHGPEIKPSSAGAKVTVACKLGVGWFQLQLCEEQLVDEQTQTGIRTVKVWRRTGRIIRVRGTAYPRGTPPEGFPEKPKMVGGAALTHGIDKDFWDAWITQNRLNPVVVNGMIYAHETESNVEGWARENAGRLSGLEPMNPKDDKRMPKSTRADIDDVKTEDTVAAKFDRAAAASRG